MGNWERLNNVRNKLRFNKNLSVKDGLNLGIVVLFAPESCARERTREALHYLLESNIKSKRLEYVLYSVFYNMIDAYYDDEKEFERMIKMLNQKVSPETKEKYASEIRRENRLKTLEAERNKLNTENIKITAERDEAYDLIALLLSENNNNGNKDLEKKIRPYKKILKKCNV